MTAGFITDGGLVVATAGKTTLEPLRAAMSPYAAYCCQQRSRGQRVGRGRPVGRVTPVGCTARQMGGASEPGAEVNALAAVLEHLAS